MSSKSWTCNSCGLSNNQNKESCQACFTARPIKEYSMHVIQNRLLAIAGYSKRNFTSKSIPNDVLNLICQFYTTAIFWSVCKDEISPLHKEDFWGGKSDESRSILFGPSFVIKSIQFGFQLQRTSEDTLLFQIYLPQGLPSNITNITASVELYCHETDTKHRKFVFLDDHGFVIWRYYALPFKDALNYKQLNLSGDVEILSIVAKNENNKITQSSNLLWSKPLEIDTYHHDIKYEWNVDEKILNEFKNCKNGVPFWAPDSFGIGDNFCLYCTPNGCNTFDVGNCVLFIQLLALPYPVKKINIKYKIECFGGDGDNFYVHYEEADEELYESVYWPDGTLITPQLQNLSSLQFVVTIQIMSTSKELWVFR